MSWIIDYHHIWMKNLAKGTNATVFARPVYYGIQWWKKLGWHIFCPLCVLHFIFKYLFRLWNFHRIVLLNIFILIIWAPYDTPKCIQTKNSMYHHIQYISFNQTTLFYFITSSTVLLAQKKWLEYYSVFSVPKCYAEHQYLQGILLKWQTKTL